MITSTVDELTLDERCPRCKAAPCHECNVRASGRGWFHAGRIDRGLRRWRRHLLEERAVDG